MKKWQVFILFCIFTICCTPPQAPPDGLITRDKFVKVLTDIQLLEATYVQKYSGIINTDSIMIPRYKGVFEKHEIETEAFERSFNYYMTDEDVINGIYDEVISNLGAMSDKINADQN